MRTRELAFERVAIGSIAALSRSRNCRDDSVLIDAADGVALGVRNVNTAVRGAGNTLRSRELRQFGIAAIARVAFFAGTCDMVNAPLFSIDAIDGVSFPQRQI